MSVGDLPVRGSKEHDALEYGSLETSGSVWVSKHKVHIFLAIAYLHTHTYRHCVDRLSPLHLEPYFLVTP